jgi:hypothetical protein
MLEGYFDHDASNKSVEIARRYGFDGIHQEFIGSYMFTMTDAMDRFVTSPTMFCLEDDWECQRDVPLDDAFDLIANYKNITQLRFDIIPSVKIPYNLSITRDFQLGKCMFTLTAAEKWSTFPALWDMAYIRPLWEGRESRGTFWLHDLQGPIYRQFKNVPEDPLAKQVFIADNIGWFVWGPPEEDGFFVHTGDGQSRRDQQFSIGNPGP